MSSDSVFGYDDHHPPQGHILPTMQLRPLSAFTVNSVHSPMKEDDTMISVSVFTLALAWVDGVVSLN
jgi:hypothetical protein